MTDELEQAVQSLFDRLGDVSVAHEEFTDTDVREAVHLTLNRYFVWAKSEDVFPLNFSMFSDEGNERVRTAIQSFVDGEACRACTLPIGKARLELLQRGDRAAKNGMRYDELFGHVDEPLPPDPLPSHMFERTTS